MEAYNYNLLINEISLLPNKNLDLDLINQESTVIKSDSKQELNPSAELVNLPVKNIDFNQELNRSAELVNLPLKNKEDEKIQKLTLNLPKKNIIDFNSNYTIIEPLQTLHKSVKRNSLIMTGGNITLDFQQKLKIIYNNPEKLSVIIKFYYDNYNQLINSKQIINVLISLIYNEFTDSDITKQLESIITLEYIKTIPEMYKFNFHDKVMGDLLKVCPDIKEKFKILDENINLVQNTNNFQKGGKKSNKRIDTSNDKTVEEKIKNNINTLTTFLKSKRINISQKGGAISINDMLRDINTFNRLTPDQKKDKKNIRDTEEKANIWVVELLEQKLASKIIKDDEHNIARYYLVKSVTAIDPNMNLIIDFINDHASILTLRNTDRIKVDIPNQITVSNYGSSVSTRITDKLKTYFAKKYDELVKIRNIGESNERKELTEPLQKIQFLLTQKGGLIGKTCVEKCAEDKKLGKQIEETFEEKCFTSRQLRKFLNKVSSYIRSTGKVIDDSDITRITNDINNLKKIEDELVKNYTIFANYIKIQEVYPDTSAKEITINHMKNVIENNQQLFDKYGNINTELLDVINKVERYSNLKEYTEMVDMTKELNQLSQSGGKSFTTNKSYLKFNTQNDIEHFTSRSFQKMISELEKENDE
jgi:hypothetical protein